MTKTKVICVSLWKIKEENLTFSVSISHTTLYSYIDKDVFLGVTNKDLPRHGDQKQKYDKALPARLPKGDSIEDRPEEINRRECFGNWEMDTVLSKKNGSPCRLLMLTERKYRRELSIPIPDGTTESVVKAMDRLERKLGTRLFRKIFHSITVDNGSEFQDCEGIENSCLEEGKRTHIYYCHPFCPGERGSNEHANGMFRRWFPKGTDFADVTDEQVAQVEHWINGYPRGILGGRSADSLLMERAEIIGAQEIQQLFQ